MKDRILEKRAKAGAVLLILIVAITTTSISISTIGNNSIITDGMLSCGTFDTPYNDTVTIAKAGGDYTTIQSALDANPNASTLFVVYPGTYTETITFTANKQVITSAGHVQNVILRQVDAVVVNVTNFNGCLIKYINIQLYEPTSEVAMISVGDGFLGVYSCKLQLNTSTNIIGSEQPRILNVYGSGLYKQKLGEFEYFHTGDTTNGIKSPYHISGTGEINLLRPCKANITCSGTGLVTTLFEAHSTAVFKVSNLCSSVISDPDTSIVAGLGYIQSGIDVSQDLTTCNLNVIGGSGETYGFYNNGTGTIHSSFNNLNMSGGTSNYAFHSNASATIISHFDDIIAADGKSGNGTFSFVNSQRDGELDITGDLNIVGNAAVNYGDVFRTKFCSTTNARVEQQFVGDKWWNTLISPGLNWHENFVGVRGEKDRLQSNYQYAVRSNGDKPRPSSNDTDGGAVKIPTYIQSEDYIYIANGDKDNVLHPWNASRKLTIHMHFKLAQTTDCHAFFGFGTEAETLFGNFTGIRYNTSSPAPYNANFYMVMNNGSGETNVSLGAADTDWHVVWIQITPGNITYSFDDSNNAWITTNVFEENVQLTWLSFIQTFAAAEKSMYVQHLNINQNFV